MRHLRGALIRPPVVRSRLSRPAPRHTAAVLIFLLSATGADAASSPCGQPSETPRLVLGAERGEAVRLAGAGGAESRLTRSRVAWQGLAGQARLPVSAGHSYSIHDITPLFSAGPGASQTREPSTNGHLHVLHAGVALAPLLPEGWDLRLQAALAVSSNFLKEPEEIDRHAAQLNGALLRDLDLGTAGRWQAGLCGDHRFGDWRVYPVLAWRWERGPWSLRLGWPDNEVARRVGERWQTSLTLAPDGNRWRILDEAIGDACFVHEAWRLRWSLDWRPLPRWSLRLHAGALLDTAYAFTLETGERYEGGTDSPLQLGLDLRWHFAD